MTFYVSVLEAGATEFGAYETTDVVPGQPIPIVWQLDLVDTDLDVGKVSARVLLVRGVNNSEVIYDSHQLIPLTATGNTRSTGQQHLQIDLSDPPFDGTTLFAASQLASDLWTWESDKPLRLELTGTGADPGPYVADTTFNVVPDGVRPEWWSWTSPPLFELGTHWKESYTLEGQLGDFSTYPNMTASGTHASLLEAPVVNGIRGTFQTQQTPPWSQDLPNSNLPGHTATVPFLPITKDWEWFSPPWDAPGFWWPHDLGKNFEYIVRFNMQDQFGNVYGPFDSASRLVEVNVSSDKMQWLIWANLHQGAAISASIASVFWPPAAAVAGGAQAAATASAGEANDPPIPNNRYGDSAPIPRRLGERELRELDDFQRLYAVVVHVLAIQNTLTEIAGRLLGARENGDHAATRRQTADYRKAVKAFSLVGADYRSAAARFAAAASQTDAFSPRRLSSQMREWGTKLPPAAARTLANNGVPELTIAALRRRLKDDPLPVLTRSSIGQLATASSAALTGLILSVERRATLVLRPASNPSRPRTSE